MQTQTFQSPGLFEQGRVNSWPLSWIQKYDTERENIAFNKIIKNMDFHITKYAKFWSVLLYNYMKPKPLKNSKSI